MSIENLAKYSAFMAYLFWGLFPKSFSFVFLDSFWTSPIWPDPTQFWQAFVVEVSVALPVMVILFYAAKTLRYFDSKLFPKNEKDESQGR